MSTISNLTISESEYPLANGGKGKIAVFMYTGSLDPNKVLDEAVRDYVSGKGYHQLIDAFLDNPWMRVILSNINDMKQMVYDPTEHKLEKPFSL